MTVKEIHVDRNQLGATAKELGSGGYGTVYAHSKKTLCLKETVFPMPNELNALMRLKGKKLKNVVTIHDVVYKANKGVCRHESQSRLYVVMERLRHPKPMHVRWFVELQTATKCDIWAARSSMTLLNKDVASYIRKCSGAKKKFCQALVNGAKELHKHGIVHEDVHDENFMITKDGVPKFVDFGIVKLRARHKIKKPKTVK